MIIRIYRDGLILLVFYVQVTEGSDYRAGHDDRLARYLHSHRTRANTVQPGFRSWACPRHNALSCTRRYYLRLGDRVLIIIILIVLCIYPRDIVVHTIYIYICMYPWCGYFFSHYLFGFRVISACTSWDRRGERVSFVEKSAFGRCLRLKSSRSLKSKYVPCFRS